MSDLRLQKSSTMGSKYFDAKRAMSKKQPDDIAAMKRVFETPHIHVAECSWIGEDVPETVRTLNDLIGEELPIIDDALITGITDAYNQRNTSSFSLTPFSEVCAFCEANRGKRVYIINW